MNKTQNERRRRKHVEWEKQEKKWIFIFKISIFNEKKKKWFLFRLFWFCGVFFCKIFFFSLSLLHSYLDCRLEHLRRQRSHVSHFRAPFSSFLIHIEFNFFSLLFYIFCLARNHNSSQLNGENKRKQLKKIYINSYRNRGKKSEIIMNDNGEWRHIFPSNTTEQKQKKKL